MTTTPKLTLVAGVYPTALSIDGVSIDATVTRFTLEQFSEFKRGWNRMHEPHSARLVALRMPGEEREMVGTGQTESDGSPRMRFVIDEAEIVRRRLVEMTPEQRAEYDRLHDEEEAFAAQFIQNMLAKHLRITAGQIDVKDADGTHEVTTGEEFARLFGGRDDVLAQAMRAIYAENMLPERLKNALSSQRASQSGSTASDPTDPTAPGPRLDSPAESVSAAGSVTNVVVTG